MMKLAHYHIENPDTDRLGEGAFAIVYRAFDTKLERLVALKVLKPFWLSDMKAVERFQTEAKTLANLHHPNLVTVYDVGQAQPGGELYLAQRLIEGESLAQRIERGPIPWAEASRILKQIAAALNYAHEQNLIHRDLKPSNILLENTGKVYVSDFGLVRAAKGSISLEASTGGLIGTAQYMAPEQWEDNPVSTATDIYALACVISEMLTGKKLFKAETAAAAMKLHLIDGPQLPPTWPSEAPSTLSATLSRALSQNPSDRYPSLNAFMAALNPQSQPTPAPKAPAKAARPKWQWLGGLLAALLLLGVGAWAGTTFTSPPSPTVAVVVAPTDTATPTNTPIPPTATHTRTPRPTATDTPVPPTATNTPRPTNTPVPPTDTPRPPNSPGLGEGSTRQRPLDGMTQVYVPAGSFMMGSAADDPQADDDESPIHQVTLDAFWLDQTEVTNAQYTAYLNTIASQVSVENNEQVRYEDQLIYDLICTGCDDWEDRITWDGNRFAVTPGYENHPVALVTWYGADNYCTWVGGDLPTEAQWEYAARGPASLVYPWGNTFNSQNLNYCDSNCDRDWADESTDDGYQFTAPVGSFPAGDSWVGAVDMSGNVWEWVSDWYDADYYTNSPSDNPHKSLGGENKVLRGGSWSSNERITRSASRDGFTPSDRSLNIGFRCRVLPGN